MDNFPQIIQANGGKSAVSARELHEFLGSKRDFSDWIKYRIKQIGLIKDQDYATHHKFVERAKLIEYILTLESAKQLAMMEGTEKGRQVRLYFIRCEERLKEVVSKSNDAILLNLSKLMVGFEERLKSLESSKTVNNRRINPEVDLNLCRRILAVRLALGLKQWEFARPMNYNQGSISMIERGAAQPGRKLMEYIVDMYHVRESFLSPGRYPIFKPQRMNSRDMKRRSEKTYNLYFGEK